MNGSTDNLSVELGMQIAHELDISLGGELEVLKTASLTSCASLPGCFNFVTISSCVEFYFRTQVWEKPLKIFLVLFNPIWFRLDDSGQFFSSGALLRKYQHQPDSLHLITFSFFYSIRIAAAQNKSPLPSD